MNLLMNESYTSKSVIKHIHNECMISNIWKLRSPKCTMYLANPIIVCAMFKKYKNTDTKILF